MNLYKPKDVAKFYNISPQTLRRWETEGKIEAVKTDGGHRRYKIPELHENGKSFIYARVSSSKQKKDL